MTSKEYKAILEKIKNTTIKETTKHLDDFYGGRDNWPTGPKPEIPNPNLTADGYEPFVGMKVWWECDIHELGYPWTVKAIKDGKAHVDDTMGQENGEIFKIREIWHPINKLVTSEFAVVMSCLNDLEAEINLIKNKYNSQLKNSCINKCLRPATWERKTQFAGRHLYCGICAPKEKDFGKYDPSYFYWTEIK